MLKKRSTGHIERVFKGKSFLRASEFSVPRQKILYYLLYYIIVELFTFFENLFSAQIISNFEGSGITAAQVEAKPDWLAAGYLPAGRRRKSEILRQAGGVGGQFENSCR